jgi:hypothetical protein
MKIAVLFALLFLCALAQNPARAEPYFAVRMGLKCSACHVNPTGGGMRNAYGEVWGQTVLPAHQIDIGTEAPWIGEISRFLAIGGNLRATANYTRIPHENSLSEFDLEELRVYLDVRVIPERLSVYVDQRLAPGASTNAEAYGRLWFGGQRYYIKAGQMFLPYGLRLQDDSAFIRQVPGINFATPDHGVEFGLETGGWSAQVAISNGSAGGPELDNGKQVSLRFERVMPAWRVGASFNTNHTEVGDRRMGNLFAGLRTGPIAWLAEADYIDDHSLVPRRKQWAGLVEADWNLLPGQNLKLTAENFDPDTDVSEDQQARYSLLWEYAPIQFVQLRAGVRYYDGIPQNDRQNRQQLFVQLNGYF